MPVIIEGGRVPTRWAQWKTGSTPASARISSHTNALHLAFINNMPDSALEDTELQFFELVDTASQEIPVYIKLYSLPGIPRTERGSEHLTAFYFEFNDLWKHKCDGAIITGTEPHEANLRDEPYWKLLGEVFDWAGRETTSTLLSCLAAHASVLHHDGVNRHRLPNKQFGVFESQKRSKDRLTSKLPAAVRFPHSRWNELRESEIVSAGYSVLTSSKNAGIDLFVKQHRRSLVLHCQGHPEYSAETLFKEYRRDIRRFLRGERETYPLQPQGYFDRAASEVFAKFRETALVSKSEEIMASFPESVAVRLRNGWRSSAISIYRQWLQYIGSERTVAGLFPAMFSRYGNAQGKSVSATRS
jgi:homoserine O-succinyltransferase